MKPLFRVVLFALLTFLGVAGPLLRGQVVIDNGLVVLLTEDFTGGLGTAPGQVRWAGSGGFAAVGGDRVVQIGEPNALITWTSQYFVGNGNTLILGGPSADGTLIWNKAIFLGANRRIRVLHGIGNTTRADARIDRALFGSRLTLEGDGRLDMTANNPNLTGFVIVLGAELRLNSNGKLNSLTRVDIQMGGTFTLDNAGTSNATTGGQYISDRFTKAIRLTAGTFRTIGQTSDGDSLVNITRIFLDQGANTIDIINNRAGFFTEVRANALTVSHMAATVNFISSSGVSDFGDDARLKLSAPPTLFNEILPYATVSGTDWASVNGNYIISYWDYNTDSQSNWNSPAINASPTADQVLSGNRRLNSLRLTGGLQVDIGTRALTINAGALLSTGAASNTISGGLLRIFGERNYVHVYNTGGAGLTITSQIIGRTLIKTGPGNLTFSGTTANALNGGAYVNEGMLILNKSAGIAAISSQIGWKLTIGDRGHSAIVRLDNHEQIANGADVWLRGGFADPVRHVGLAHEAVLQFNGAGGMGITETFRALDVEGRGVLDFQGGTLASANFLILDDLRGRHNAEGGSVLLVRNWVEFEDRLLVKRSSANLDASLPYIHFEGYAPGAITRDYDAIYWEVVPFPEPSTYGAILGALGLGLWVRQRRKSCKRYP